MCRLRVQFEFETEGAVEKGRQRLRNGTVILRWDNLSNGSLKGRFGKVGELLPSFKNSIKWSVGTLGL